jgi:hypothetical protein
MAAQTTATSENKKKIWSVNFRPKVGQSVSYLGNQWLSISGINSEPTLSNDDDWILVKESNNNEFLKLTDALTTVTNTNKLITDEDYKGLIFISQWNATTNTPTLTNSNPSKFREAYINLSASTRFGIAWEKGDYLVYDFDGNIFKEDNPLLNIVSTVGFSNDYDDLDSKPDLSVLNPLIAHLEFDNTDKTVWNNGKGDVNENTSFGENALQSNTTGNNNTANGKGALRSNTTGRDNTAHGFDAGRYIFNNIPNLNSIESIFIGKETRAKEANGVNEIVIGSEALGEGSNTAVIGNNNIENTYIKGNLKSEGFHTFLDSFATDGTGVSSESMFKGNDGNLYYKSSLGAVTKLN